MRCVLLPFCLLIHAGVLSCSLEDATADAIQQIERWGIYALDTVSRETTLLYSSSTAIANVRPNPANETLVFSRLIGGESLNHSEIFTINTDGGEERRLTRNGYIDTYPVWSPDGGIIAYLSWPNDTLDIYMMEKDGSGGRLLYDSGTHDADIDWVGDVIAFTRDSRIWVMNADGTGARAITDPPRAGWMGKANLPFGDYDPRIHPGLGKIVFERLEGDASPYGIYDLYLVNLDGTGLEQITATGYTQGLPSWSPDGGELIFIVTAMDGAGAYDLYAMNADGTNSRNITPGNFPANALIHEAVFSRKATLLYIIVEWWE